MAAGLDAGLALGARAVQVSLADNAYHYRADGDRLHLGWFAAVARQLRGPIPATASALQPASRASRSGAP